MLHIHLSHYTTCQINELAMIIISILYIRGSKWLNNIPTITQQEVWSPNLSCLDSKPWLLAFSNASKDKFHLSEGTSISSKK